MKQILYDMENQASLTLSGEKTKNDIRAMKQILYDMGPLTLVRWPL